MRVCDQMNTVRKATPSTSDVTVTVSVQLLVSAWANPYTRPNSPMAARVVPTRSSLGRTAGFTFSIRRRPPKPATAANPRFT